MKIVLKRRLETMRYIINFWTEAGITCIYATDDEKAFLKKTKSGCQRV